MTIMEEIHEDPFVVLGIHYNKLTRKGKRIECSSHADWEAAIEFMGDEWGIPQSEWSIVKAPAQGVTEDIDGTTFMLVEPHNFTKIIQFISNGLFTRKIFTAAELPMGYNFI